jgi:glycosyltransferase involved in cell wall biosynthesis
MKIKHAVVMVTYNHEKYIYTALNSIFDNTVLPDEVILFDDCSTDKTWDIIQEFKKEYPSILDCKRNETNLGIYKNMSNMWDAAKSCNADIISVCVGDDFLYKGIFEELNRVVEENKIDLQSDFIIITNSSELYPNGKERSINNYKFLSKNIFKARLRGIISYREVGVSKCLAQKVENNIRHDLGLWSDLLQVVDRETKCKQFYFSDFVASCYRVGVGIVSKSKSIEILESKQMVNNEIMIKYRDRLDYKDINYLKWENQRFFLSKNYNLKNWFIYFFYYIKKILNGDGFKGVFLLVPDKIRYTLKFLRRKIG